MNIATGIRIAAKHDRYKRASGPLDEKYRLNTEKYIRLNFSHDDYYLKKKNATGTMILGKSSSRNPIVIQSLSKTGEKSNTKKV